MSATVTVNTDNQLNINRDTAKVFLDANRYENEVYENTTGGDVTITKGQLMGRISASGKLLPLKSAAADGSQYPVGIATKTETVADTVEINMSICVAGDVAEEQLVFDGADTLSTVVDGKQLRDRIASDTVGIKLVETTDLTNFDN